MEEIRELKNEIRSQISMRLDSLSDEERSEKTKNIENRLFEFANFLEAKIVLFYLNRIHEVMTWEMIQRCFGNNKIVVLPSFGPENHDMALLKIDTLDTGLKSGPRGIKEPDGNRCKVVPIEYVDIAIIPGIAFDEKAGRIGSGEGYYDRFIPKLPVTTRKVSLAFEDQIVQQIPMESHDRYVDIIITEKRIIYKI